MGPACAPAQCGSALQLDAKKKQNKICRGIRVLGTDSYYDSPPPIPSTFFNERFMASRHQKGCDKKKHLLEFFLFARKGLSNDGVGVAKGVVLQETLPGARFKTGDFVQEKFWGGATAGRLLDHTPRRWFTTRLPSSHGIRGFPSSVDLTAFESSSASTSVLLRAQPNGMNRGGRRWVMPSVGSR